MFLLILTRNKKKHYSFVTTINKFEKIMKNKFQFVNTIFYLENE